MPAVCLLDMDGVIVNFAEPAIRWHGKELHPTEIRWDFDKQIGVDPKKFWEAFGYDFWNGLPWTAEGKRLIQGLEEIFGQENIALLSSPCQTAGCIDGKIDWIRRELPQYARQFFIGPSKWQVAAPSKVLVDDRSENIDDFIAGGGEGFLIPRPWNNAAADSNHLGRFDVEVALQAIAEIATIAAEEAI